MAKKNSASQKTEFFVFEIPLIHQDDNFIVVQFDRTTFNG
jgi:hypothetical protein